MVVKVPIIGALAFLVLLDVCEGAGSCIHLFAEQFELSAGSLHTVPASVYLDGAALREGKTGLAETERFREWDDFALALVYRDADGLKSLDDFPAQLFQLLNIRKDDVVVVHIMPGNMDACLAFDEVINCARQSDHFLLAGFDAQRHPTARRRARG